MKLGRLIGVALAAAFAITAASAQSTGGLRVKIIDNSDKTPVIGAAVTLSNTNKLVATTTILSDVKGEALFPVLRAGSGYVVTVIMDGYAGIRQDASVSLGNMKDVVIALAPEHVEKVVVVGEKSQVDLDQNQQQTKFTSDFIQDLPVAGRFYQNVLALAPGVQDPDGDGNPNVNGARDRDFKTTVSGISNVDPLTGQFLNLVASDSIEEITVVTAGAGAEYGRAQGGFAQIIQKQGSNDFEGVFGMIYSSSKLDGNGATNVPNSLLPDFYRYQPSLQVSGPIMKDKLWYRLSQEYIRREDPVVLGSGGNVGTTGTDQFSTADQLTWQVSNRNKLAVQFQADPRTTTNVGLSALTPSEATQKFESGGPTYSLTWTAPYSPSLLVDTVLAYQDTKLNILPTETGVQNNCIPISILESSQCFNARNGQVSGSSPLTWKDQRQRLTLKSDATYYKGRMWGMSHQFKFGLIFENERYYRELLRTPDFTLTSGLNGQGNIGFATTVRVSLQPFSTQRSVGSSFGVYGEDVVRPLNNLSITLGLRVEQEHIASNGIQPFDPLQEANAFRAATAGLDPNQVPAILQDSFTAFEDIIGSKNAVQAQFPGVTLSDSSEFTQQQFWHKFRNADNIDITNVNIAPRLSIAWDPWNDGRTKFTLSGGRYYDKIFLAVPLAEIEPVVITQQWSAEDLAQGTTLPYSPEFQFSTVSRNLKTPYNDEYTFSFEREIWQESSISLRYVHRNFKDQLQDIDINQIPGDYGRCVVQAKADQPYIVASPGTGTRTDPYTGKTYQDNDPGIGDGRQDDCSGLTSLGDAVDTGGPGGAKAPLLQRPDGFADLYVLNPAWSSIFQIGNYNSAQYDGIILEFVRRQYKNWQMEASYTLSKATGDGEDYALILGDDRSTLQDEKGYQSYDRRHAVKVNATTITPWGFRLGGAIQWQSGLPYSILTRNFGTVGTPPDYIGLTQTYDSTRTSYPTHHRNDQRNRAYWNVDAKFVKEMTLAKGMNLQLTAEIFNLLNMDTYIVYNTALNQGRQVNGFNDAYRRFGRQYQIGMRLAF